MVQNCVPPDFPFPNGNRRGTSPHGHGLTMKGAFEGPVEEMEGQLPPNGYDMIWHDMTWYDMTWHDTLW